MRFMTTTLVASVLLVSAACSRAARDEGGSSAGPSSASSTTVAQRSDQTAAGQPRPQSPAPELSKVSAVQPNAPAEEVGRKIIRNAELTLESETPEEGLRKIAAIAESRGGFVVTSEVRQQDTGESKDAKIVTVVARVPSAQFETSVEEIRKVGSRVLQEKRTGQDVTEEYIDLEARIRSMKALEAQFLEIMKQAQKVSDALDVQRQLADVRTDIERLEGRRRFLESQSSLSTITVRLQPPLSIVGATPGGFFSGVKEALSDGISVAVTIILVLIRVALALIPILLLIVLPIIGVWRFFVRRSRRVREAK